MSQHSNLSTEVDWLFDDAEERDGIALIRPFDKDAEGEVDLEPEGGEDAGDNPSSNEEVEQRAMVNIYLIPSMKPISIVYFGPTKKLLTIFNSPLQLRK